MRSTFTNFFKKGEWPKKVKGQKKAANLGPLTVYLNIHGHAIFDFRFFFMNYAVKAFLNFKFIAGVKDTGDKLYGKLTLMTGVLDTGHKFITGVLDTGDKSYKGILPLLLTPAVNLPLVSLTPVINLLPMSAPSFITGV